jgi:hypothetical protein
MADPSDGQAFEAASAIRGDWSRHGDDDDGDSGEREEGHASAADAMGSAIM